MFPVPSYRSTVVLPPVCNSVREVCDPCATMSATLALVRPGSAGILPASFDLLIANLFISGKGHKCASDITPFASTTAACTETLEEFVHRSVDNIIAFHPADSAFVAAG